MLKLTTGDVLLTRNTDEVGNGSPGYWNHAAVVASYSLIVEAQESLGVICVPAVNFWNRYPKIIVLRSSRSGSLLGHEARHLVGEDYSKMASLFSWFKRCQPMNCVGLVRKCFYNVTQQDPKWKVPDHILQSQLFYKVDHKNHANWAKPDEWFEGALDYWPERII